VVPGRSASRPCDVGRRGAGGRLSTSPQQVDSTDSLYDTIENEVVQAAYEFCHGNQVHSAELLGISRNVLRAQLKRFGLLPKRGRRTAPSRERAAQNLQLEPCRPPEDSSNLPEGVISWAA
jgi:hypothetical protein